MRLQAFQRIENIRHTRYLHSMSLDIATPLGIMADSHGNNEFLLEAILTLKGLGADRLIHLGDICDSRAPIGLIRQALDILSRHGVQAVRGNNECVLLHNAQSSRHKDDRAEIIPLLEALPYTIRMGDRPPGLPRK